MKILFHLGHPAHFHFFKNVIDVLLKKNHKVFILIKKKDILENLLKKTSFDYINILPEGRKNSKLGITWGIMKKNWKLFKFCLKNRPDILIGTSVEITHVGKILKIPSLVTREDDYYIGFLFSKLAYPLASNIIAPTTCKTGSKDDKWEKKTIHYSGFHELAYLHPKNFKPDINIVKKRVDLSRPFFILRFSNLNAHHDKGKTGITPKIAEKIISILERKGNVYITSERNLESKFEKYRIKMPIDLIHHALFFSDMYIGDSQTMAVESGILGTPFIRFNDFVGEIGCLNELENTYKLGFGFKTTQVEEMIKKIRDLLDTTNLKEIFKKRRQKMFSEKIDVASFLVWFIENYPKSQKLKLYDKALFESIKEGNNYIS